LGREFLQLPAKFLNAFFALSGWELAELLPERFPFRAIGSARAPTFSKFVEQLLAFLRSKVPEPLT